MRARIKWRERALPAVELALDRAVAAEVEGAAQRDAPLAGADVARGLEDRERVRPGGDGVPYLLGGRVDLDLHAQEVAAQPRPGAVQGRRLARDSNDYAARLAADFPGRFGIFAAVPLPHIEASLREIEYGLDVLKADGISLFTSYRDKWLGDPAFDPVMAELDRRKAVVFVHPEAPLCCRGLLPGVHEHVLEYGFDTTRAITRILFSGTALRYRDIRWIFCHGGGTTPFLAERLVRAPGTNKALAQYVPDGVMAELRRFHYDVAQIAHPMALAALTRLVPISQILWGTDFPFRFGTEYVKGLSEFGFSAGDLRQIDRENALRLLPRWRDVGAA